MSNPASSPGILSFGRAARWKKHCDNSRHPCRAHTSPSLGLSHLTENFRVKWFRSLRGDPAVIPPYTCCSVGDIMQATSACCTHSDCKWKLEILPLICRWITASCLIWLSLIFFFKCHQQHRLIVQLLTVSHSLSTPSWFSLRCRANNP